MKCESEGMSLATVTKIRGLVKYWEMRVRTALRGKRHDETSLERTSQSVQNLFEDLTSQRKLNCLTRKSITDLNNAERRVEDIISLFEQRKTSLSPKS